MCDLIAKINDYCYQEKIEIDKVEMVGEASRMPYCDKILREELSNFKGIP